MVGEGRWDEEGRLRGRPYVGGDGLFVSGGFVLFCGGNEGWIWVRRGDGIFHGGMVAGKGEFRQWEDGSWGVGGEGMGPRMREDTGEGEGGS